MVIDYLKWNPKFTIGLGTQLDTARFRSLIAADLDSADQVKALILGEHGDSMVPIWSSATVAGMPLIKIRSVRRIFSRRYLSGPRPAGPRRSSSRAAPAGPWD